MITDDYEYPLKRQPCLIYDDGGWWETDWDDPLVIEEEWNREQAKVFCQFYYIEHGLNEGDIPF